MWLRHEKVLYDYKDVIKKLPLKDKYTKDELLINDFLMKYVYENFIEELESLDNPKEVLLIPLGKAVEEVLCKLKEQGIIGENQILTGFPHPSGANVNRLIQFEQNKENMIKLIEEYASFK